MAGMAGLSLPNLLQAREEGAKSGRAPKDTRCILIWLDGGPSHMDMYDMKPEAPPEYRGLWRPIRTNVPGMHLTELFPRQAKVADKFSIVRSLHHGNGDHFAGAHVMLTGRWGATGADTAGRSPSIASFATKVTGARRPGLPSYVAVPYASSVGLRPGYFGGDFLGRQHDPFQTEGNPNSDKFQVRDLHPPGGLSVERLGHRRSLLKDLDDVRRVVDISGQIDSMNDFERQAYELVTRDEVRKAFDLSAEDPKLRDRYGRNTWGQSTLLARRLAEAGVTFVNVHMGGWDHHWDMKKGLETIFPNYDAAVATLFEDLAARGLWEKVLVVICGEFSRTPKMNDGSGRGTPGRDHWGDSMFCVLGGGGVKGGVIVGATDRRGERPAERPLTPGDIHATIYHVLGVDPQASFVNTAGRPITALEHGKPIKELL
jgi:hypothetical protein